MEYFESDVPIGDGRCSDNACPCSEVLIQRGTGYVYIDQSLVDFRRQYPTLESARKAMKQRHQELRNSFGGTDVSLVYQLGPILVCEQGAKNRNLNLEVAAEDARRWWQTGKVPLRATPLKGADLAPSASKELKADEKKKDSSRVPLSKSITDAVLANLRSYKPEVDLTQSCPKCGKEPLPFRMITHLFAVGCAMIDCQHCGSEIPLSTALNKPCSIFSTTPLDELDLDHLEFVELGKDISQSNEKGSKNVSDQACLNTYPTISFAAGFYDGADRLQKFPSKIVSFAEHLDVLCNLKALKICASNGTALHYEKTLQCFNRATGLLLLSNLVRAQAELLKIPQKIVDEWEGLLWNTAYLFRALSEADRILSQYTKAGFSEAELKKSWFSGSPCQMPTTHDTSICAIDIRRMILDNLSRFFHARFLIQKKERTLTDAGYEAYKIADCIKEAFYAIGVNGYSRTAECANLENANFSIRGDGPVLKNAALIYIHYTKNSVDMKDFRVYDIGKLSAKTPFLKGWLKKIFS